MMKLKNVGNETMESSDKCKNSSRRDSRPKNMILQVLISIRPNLLIFENKNHFLYSGLQGSEEKRSRYLERSHWMRRKFFRDI